jgi:hypothetical protein
MSLAELPNSANVSAEPSDHRMQAAGQLSFIGLHGRGSQAE